MEEMREVFYNNDQFEDKKLNSLMIKNKNEVGFSTIVHTLVMRSWEFFVYDICHLLVMTPGTNNVMIISL
ncbi:hypothetical protein CVN76_10125 [Bacillus sp. mrc49]|nr:hypothetical protein CVN76_10125 [Bacillus sp. mrc49]